MDFGIILGALIASALAGAFVLHRKIPGKLALGAVIGGDPDGLRRPARLRLQHRRLLRWHRLVQPARLDLGRVRASVGTFAGLALRPLFGLTNPKPSDSVC